MNSEIKGLLQGVKDGKITVENAVLKLKKQPFEDLGFAKVDLHRQVRQGRAEVIYGAGKTSEQIISIINSMQKNGQHNILVTRLDEMSFDEVSASVELNYCKDAKIGIVGSKRNADGIGRIVVISGGTSDMHVAEEAAVTAEFFGNEVVRIYDAGVSGLHRLLSHLDEIMSASVIITVAGMEGALASVVGGLADCPVIAVPTSVGYGASFDGLSALLSMLNSCSAGVTVVNIDNGFGAGYMADMINHMGVKNENSLS